MLCYKSIKTNKTTKRGCQFLGFNLHMQVSSNHESQGLQVFRWLVHTCCRAYIRTSVFFIVEKYSIIFMYFVLFIHLSDDIDFIFFVFHFLDIVSNAGMNIGGKVSKFLFLFILGVYIGVKLLDHLITLCIFLKICQFVF